LLARVAAGEDARLMSNSLVIEGARLLDGRGGEPVDGASLVVTDGRITYAGPSAAPGAPETRAIDAGGRTLIPGLIDCHVHLCFDGLPDFEQESHMPAGRAAVKAVRNAGHALDAGITTVRDLGGIGSATIDVAWAQREGILRGPRILTAGEVLTITGGHGHFIGREVDSAVELIKAVRSLRKAGADLIKIIATGGVLTPGIGARRMSFSADEIAAAVSEAHEGGMRVAAHAIGAEGIVAALQGGVDSIEHGCYMTDEAIKLLLSNPSWFVTTLVAPHQICFGGEGVPDYAIEKSKEVMGSHRDSVARAIEAGVRFATGTDAGTPFNHHGGLALELRLLHEAGMPLDKLLVAATSEAAALMGIDDIGRLEPGAVGDVVLLDGDPLVDVGAYERVAMVVQDGRVVVDRVS